MDIFKSIAGNRVLTTVDITGPTWPWFDSSCRDMLTELLLENYTIRNFWFYQLNDDYYHQTVPFDSVTNRNKLLRKQQRFKKVKAVTLH